MGKVKWNAKHDYEYVENYKVLQQAFLKNDIKRYIDVDKLIKAKY
jgi:microtubule-associated protein, RP/EB family